MVKPCRFALLDVYGDGSWDYMYDIQNKVVSAYTTEISEEQIDDFI
jgi:hypothetical protein